MGFATRSQAEAAKQDHQKIVALKKLKGKPQQYGLKNKKVGGKSVNVKQFYSTKLHKTKSKSIYSFHHGKKSCGRHGSKGIKGWCQGNARLKSRRKKGGSYWLRTRSRRSKYLKKKKKKPAPGFFG